MARGREEPGLATVGLFRLLLRVLQRQLDFAARFQLALQAVVELLGLAGPQTDGLLELRGGLEPRERRALVVDRTLHPVHQGTHRFTQRDILVPQPLKLRGRRRGPRFALCRHAISEPPLPRR